MAWRRTSQGGWRDRKGDRPPWRHQERGRNLLRGGSLLSTSLPGLTVAPAAEPDPEEEQVSGRPPLTLIQESPGPPLPSRRNPGSSGGPTTLSMVWFTSRSPGFSPQASLLHTLRFSQIKSPSGTSPSLHPLPGACPPSQPGESWASHQVLVLVFPRVPLLLPSCTSIMLSCAPTSVYDSLMLGCSLQNCDRWPQNYGKTCQRILSMRVTRD